MNQTDDTNTGAWDDVVIGAPGRGRSTPAFAASAVRVFGHVRRGEPVTAILDPLGELGEALAQRSHGGPATRELSEWGRELQDAAASSGRRAAARTAPRWDLGGAGLERGAGDRAAALLHVRSIARTINVAVDEVAGDALTRLADPDDTAGAAGLDETYAQISGLKSVMVAVDWQLAEVHALWARALREEAEPAPVDEDQLDLGVHPDVEAGALHDAELAEEFSFAARGRDALEETFDAVWSVFRMFVDEHGPLRRMCAGAEVVR
ncbi:MAG: hypothetical protein AAGC46_09995 [Solirubrobacteraceae bacterium]|nr:hypothetical protein [Patulibacter sp.]